MDQFETTIMLREMAEKDLDSVIDLHVRYIPSALFPRLGVRFMRNLYRVIMELDGAQTFVWDEDGKVVAFITVTADPSVISKRLVTGHFVECAMDVAGFLLKNPGRIRELTDTVSYGRIAEIPGVTADMPFIAMEREYRKRNMADELVMRCVRWVREKGFSRLKVSTGTENHGANALLRRLGFVLVREMPFRGEKINLYLYESGENSD